MVPLAIFGYLMCNVLSTWATLHQPYIPTPKQALSSPPPQNKNEWVHSVIFEPQLKISIDWFIVQSDILSLFSTILRGFQSVIEYLKDLTRDINKPAYFQKIVSPFNNFQNYTSF